MKINCNFLEEALDRLISNIRFSETKPGSDMFDIEDVDDWRRELEYVKALQLVEEKRRLLANIFQLLNSVFTKSITPSSEYPQGIIFVSSVGKDFFFLVELNKKVNSAQTMDELKIISEELIEFIQQHPGLEKN